MVPLRRAMRRSSDKCWTGAEDIGGAGKESPRLCCVPVSKLEVLTGISKLRRRLRSSKIDLRSWRWSRGWNSWNRKDGYDVPISRIRRKIQISLGKSSICRDQILIVRGIKAFVTFL